jgi:GH25 family lysozyme M1 (1,4-beta-N-acetylmuramidase)
MQTPCSPQTIWADLIQAAWERRRGVKIPVTAAVALMAFAAPAKAQRVLGIDVSAWQGNLSTTNWATLKRPTDQQVNSVFGDGRDFVFIRSSRGGTTGYYDQNDSDNSNGLNTLSQRYDDPYFVQNITRATAAGMLAGPYHFSRPDVIASTPSSGGIANTGTDEANHFIQMAGPWMRPGYLLPVHDFEAGSGARSNDQMAQFVIDFSNRGLCGDGYSPHRLCWWELHRYPGRRLLCAAEPGCRWELALDPALAEPGRSGLHPRFRRRTRKDYTSTVYGPWDDAPNPVNPWKFWQYASTARLNGYANGGANIDVDVAQGGWNS